jgi:hypothetical protein
LSTVYKSSDSSILLQNGEPSLRFATRAASRDPYQPRCHFTHSLCDGKATPLWYLRKRLSLQDFAQTCTAMYELFKSSSALAYTIQLYLDGLKDAGTSYSHSVLIESLVRRRQAWLALDVKEPLIRAQPYFTTYEIAGGAFAHISSDYFEISWLPTAHNANGRTHRTPLIGISPDEFTMDPTQDLVVFLEDIRK